MKKGLCKAFAFQIQFTLLIHLEGNRAVYVSDRGLSNRILIWFVFKPCTYLEVVEFVVHVVSPGCPNILDYFEICTRFEHEPD